MSTLARLTPHLFALGVIGAVASGGVLYPNAMPWQYSFWLGWFASLTFSVMARALAEQQKG